jgi:hypothetical protein
LDEFVKDHLVKNEEMDVAAATEANRVAASAMNSGAEDLVYNVIQELEANDQDLAASDDWADYAEKAKARLVGMVATVTVPRLQDDKYVFDPVMKDGKAVVRPLTAEDIDRIGPACIANIIGVV